MLKLLLAGLACYLLLVLVVYLMQARMLYLADVPGRSLDRTPAEIGSEYRDVWIRTTDGVRLHGWNIPGDTDRVLLFFHGNAGNISHRLESIRQFLRLGFSVLIIDYRGYGQSEGRTTEQGIYRDADAAWLYLTETNDTPEERIIVESTFTSVPDIAREYYPWLPVRWLSRLQHSARDFVREVESPVLVIHSRDDEIVPFRHGEAIFAAARDPKSFLEIHGTHNDAYLRDEQNYLTGLRSFLDGLRAPGPSP